MGVEEDSPLMGLYARRNPIVIGWIGWLCGATQPATTKTGILPKYPVTKIVKRQLRRLLLVDSDFAYCLIAHPKRHHSKEYAQCLGIST